jgi:hypothetical protein
MLRTDFNKNWLFAKCGEEGRSRRVDLPHDAQMEETRSADMPADSGYFPGGKYIYTKACFFPDEYADKVVYLEFDGVYRIGQVYVNGHLAAEEPHGYVNFVFPIQQLLKFGEENEIKVVADNSNFPNSRWYTGAGIYREVNMYIAEKEHILPFGVKIDATDYVNAEVKVRIESKGENCTAQTDIIFDGNIVASAKGLDFSIRLPNAELWSAETPNLYEARIRLLKDGATVDEVTETFGIRGIDYDASFGLKINGENILLRGGCVHHDNGLLGAAAHWEAEDRKVRILKEAGFNAIRSSHNPCSKAMLAACDRHGMYMMDEFADMWTQHKHKHDYATQFPEWYERDLTAMVRRDCNHPCVILYSIGNEVSESAFAEGVDYARKMTEIIHRLDASRPVTCGINLLLNGLAAMGKGLYKGDGMALDKDSSSGSAFVNGVMSKMGGLINFIGRLKKFDEATRDVFEVLDVAGYNYGSGRHKVDPKQYPHRVTVGSETFPPRLYKNWRDVKKYPNLIGDFMWTAWDYLGEAGISLVGYGNDSNMTRKYPALLAGSGVIDITGEFGPEVYWNKTIWGLYDKPYIAVEPPTDQKATFGMWRTTDARHSWAWSGREGKPTTVTVYSSSKRVELHLNGIRIGSKAARECKAVFHNVRYKPGELRAVAYNDAGKVDGEDILVSAGKDLRLSIAPEPTRLDDSELVFADIFITDGNGIREYGVDAELNILVNNADILAFGSANPYNKAPRTANTAKTFDGKTQLILRKTAAIATVTVSASEFKTVTIEL